MFTVEFYETASGESEIRDFLEKLRAKRKTDKQEESKNTSARN